MDDAIKRVDILTNRPDAKPHARKWEPQKSSESALKLKEKLENYDVENLSLAGKINNMALMLGKVVKAVVSEPATPEEAANRKAKCQACQRVDEKGERFFREFAPGVFTCGAMRLKKIVRDETRSGCGCFLKLKWGRKSQKCPLGDW